MTPASDAEAFFAGSPLGSAVHRRVLELLDESGALGDAEERVGRSQVAFRRRRGFAWLWRPTQYLGERGAEVVLAIALGREDPSPRWKQVAHPSPRHWIHHLEVRGVAELDDEVAGWLREACDRAG